MFTLVITVSYLSVVFIHNNENGFTVWWYNMKWTAAILPTNDSENFTYKPSSSE